MTIPKSFREGIAELVRTTTDAGNNIATVAIPKTTTEADIASKLLGDLISCGLKIEREYRYIPPDNVGTTAKYKHGHRQEQVPTIDNPGMTYLIIDDIIDKGGTLEIAITRLEEQGVSRDKIWFLSGCIWDKSRVNIGPFLDRASVFLDYRDAYLGIKRPKNNAEVFNVSSEILPEKLADRLELPSHIKLAGHPLLAFVEPKLIPGSIDIIVINDLTEFYNKATDRKQSTSRILGWYLNSDHSFQPREDEQKYLEMVNKHYGVDTRRAILLDREGQRKNRKADYWTLVHEYLHGVFDGLSTEARQKILASARSSFTTYQQLGDMGEFAGYDIFKLGWSDEILQRWSKARNLGELDSFMVFSNLPEKDQLDLVDEFICRVFTGSDIAFDIVRPKYLPSEFMRTLRDAGYKVGTAPEIRY